MFVKKKSVKRQWRGFSYILFTFSTCSFWNMLNLYPSQFVLAIVRSFRTQRTPLSIRPCMYLDIPETIIK